MIGENIALLKDRNARHAKILPPIWEPYMFLETLSMRWLSRIIPYSPLISIEKSPFST
jgi:hypothetical protein